MSSNKNTSSSNSSSRGSINSTVSSNTTIKKEDSLKLQLLSVDKTVEQYHQRGSSIIPKVDITQVREIISIASITTIDPATITTTNSITHSNSSNNNDKDTNKIGKAHCHAFTYQDTMLMTIPTIMAQEMDHCKFYSCVNELIEIAESIQCESLVIAVSKNSKKLNTLLRALLYIGFQLVDPLIYKQDPVYILVGYEL